MSDQEEMFQLEDLVAGVLKIEKMHIEVTFVPRRYLIRRYEDVYPTPCVGKTAKARGQLLFDRLQHMGRHYGSHWKRDHEPTILELRVMVPAE